MSSGTCTVPPIALRLKCPSVERSPTSGFDGYLRSQSAERDANYAPPIARLGFRAAVCRRQPAQGSPRPAAFERASVASVVGSSLRCRGLRHASKVIREARCSPASPLLAHHMANEPNRQEVQRFIHGAAVPFARLAAFPGAVSPTGNFPSRAHPDPLHLFRRESELGGELGVWCTLSEAFQQPVAVSR